MGNLSPSLEEKETEIGVGTKKNRLEILDIFIEQLEGWVERYEIFECANKRNMMSCSKGDFIQFLKKTLKKYRGINASEDEKILPKVTVSDDEEAISNIESLRKELEKNVEEEILARTEKVKVGSSKKHILCELNNLRILLQKFEDLKSKKDMFIEVVQKGVKDDYQFRKKDNIETVDADFAVDAFLILC